MELTVDGIHRGFADGTLTCVALVQGYIDRIAAYDRQGPALSAVITVNPNALAVAAEKDAEYAANPGAVGPLHGIPVLAKDNYSTVDIATTNGAWAFEHAVALRDATIIKKLKDAGAIILAKVNLGELAMSPVTGSALGGQCKNPYDLTRTPGGSSGGTGAGLAANFGVLGTGSDTGQSSRSPASANNCVALRPTRGLISRVGIGPGMRTQDEGGPLARTITDLAKFTDVIAGFDPLDPVTAFGEYQRPETYTAFLDANGMKGARLGLLKEVVGSEERHAEVNAVLKQSIALMESLGATVVEISIPDLDELVDDIAITKWEFRAAFEKYLTEFAPGSVRVKNTDEFFETGKEHFHPTMGFGSLDDLAAMTQDETSPEYKVAFFRRLVLAQRLMTAMAENKLDCILYPHQQILVNKIGEGQHERNGVLSNSSGLPGLCFPGGFSTPTDDAPIGVPVGIEILGPEWSEPTLFKLAFAFEQAANLRRPPLSTPALVLVPA